MTVSSAEKTARAKRMRERKDKLESLGVTTLNGKVLRYIGDEAILDAALARLAKGVDPGVVMFPRSFMIHNSLLS